MRKQISEYELDDGVYIDLAFSEYLAIDAVSASGLKAASVSWEKWNYQQKHGFQSTPEFIFGSAFDCLITEGFAAYIEQYNDGSMPSDVEYLSTAKEIKDVLRSRGLKLLGDKHETSNRLLDDGWSGIIKGVNDGDDTRVNLTKSQVGMIGNCSDAIHRAGLVSECFRGGYGQVSIVWTAGDGTKYKCRFDYLKNGAVYELKTTSGKPDKSIGECVIADVQNYRYDIAAVLYSGALHVAKDLPIIWKKNRGDDDQLRHHMKSCGVFEFVFQRKLAPFDVARALFSPVSTKTGEANRYWQKAVTDMELAHRNIDLAKENDIFNTASAPTVMELTDVMFDGWFLNKKGVDVYV